MSATPVRVLVTGAGGGGLGEQLLKALRLASTRYELIAADTTSQSLGFSLADEACVLPPASDPGYMDALCAVVTERRPEVLIPSSEPELRVVSKNRARLLQLGVFVPIQSDALIALCSDKFKTHEILARHGFHQPKFCRVSSDADLVAVDFFPCVLKPVTGGSGSSHVFIAQEPDEVRALAGYVLRSAGSLLVEEYVGRADSEFTVGVLHDMDGELVNSIAIRRSILGGLSNRLRVPNRSGRAELGDVLAISSGVSQGEVGRFETVTQACERVAISLGSCGPLNIQCRVHDDQVFVFEINPRFSGTSSLRALVGFNEPDLLIRRHVLGETIERRFAYQHGMILRGLREEFYRTM